MEGVEFLIGERCELRGDLYERVKSCFMSRAIRPVDISILNVEAISGIVRRTTVSMYRERRKR